MTEDQALNTVFTAEVGDVLNKLTAMIKGVLELASTSSELASAMGLSDKALKSFTESLKQAETVAEQFDKALAGIAAGSKGIGGAAQAGASGIDKATAATEKGAKRSQEYVGALESLQAAYGENAPMINGLIKELNKLDDAHNRAKLGAEKEGQAYNAVYESTALADQAISNYIAKANLSVPAVQNVTKAHADLNSSLSLSEFKTTSLGKAFMLTANQGDTFYESLLAGGKAFGENTVKTGQYVKSLMDVTKHLNSIPQSSLNAKAAQTELADSMTLTERAMQYMNGSITKVKDGFEAVKTSVKTGGTVMGEYGQAMITLNSAHQNLAKGFQEYTQAHKNNAQAVEQAQSRLGKYISVVDEVKAKYKDINKAVVESGDGYRIYGDKVGDAAKLQKQMSYDTGLLTQTFYDQVQVQKVLTGEQELSVQALERVAVAANGNRKGIQELAKDYTGLYEGLDQVTKYGHNYAESLRATTAANFTEQASVEQAVNAHLKYAKTAEGLIAQSEVMTQTTINKIKSSAEYTQNLEAGNAAIDSAKARHESFATALRSTEAIEQGLSREGQMNRDAMLNMAEGFGVAKEQTDGLRSAASQLLPIQEKHRSVIEALNAKIKDGSMTNEEAKRSLQAHKDALAQAALAAEELRARQEALNATTLKVVGFFKDLWKTLGNFVMFTIASTVISGITGAITGTIHSIMNFDQALHSLQAITGSTKAELAGMGDTIKETSSSSKYGAEEIARGLEIMGQAGLSASESMNTIKAATDLAMGTLEKMDTTVDLLTSTMSAYNINTLESGRVADIMAIAVNKSKLSVDKLRTTLNYVGVIAAQSGLSLEQTAASTMLLADRGMRASTIGTGLRQVLDKLIAPNEKLRDAYQAHGIALDKISPLTAGYDEALANLTKTLYNSDTGLVDTAKAFELFGIRGAQAATILIQAYASGDWQKTIDSFSEVGAAAKMAQEQMEGLSAKWDNFTAKIKVIAISLGEGGLSAALKIVIDTLRYFADGILAIMNFDWGWIGTVTQWFAALSAVIGGATLVMTTYKYVALLVATANTFLNTSVTLLKESFTQLIGVMTANWWIGALVGLTALIVLWKVWNSQVAASVEEHQKMSAKATQSADALYLFQDAVKKTTDGSKEFTVNVNRLKSEFPELAKEIANVTGVLDISSLSYKELADAMEQVRQAKLKEAIDQDSQALIELQNQGKITAFILDGLQLLFGGLNEMAKTFLDDLMAPLRFLGELKNLAFGTSQAVSAANEKTSEAMKKLAQDIVNAGKMEGASLEEQKEKSLKILQERVMAGQIEAQAAQQASKMIIEEYKKKAEQEKLAKIHYEKYVNDVSTLYGQMSIKQKMEIQTVIDEEEKAITKYRKFAKDKQIVAEEVEAAVFMIKIQYAEKAFAAMNEAVKKEYETTEMKYEREKGLLDKKLQWTEDAIQKEEQAIINAQAKGGERTAAEESEYQAHLLKMQALDEHHEDLIQGLKALTFQRTKKIYDDTLATFKANEDLYLAISEEYESKKLAMTLAGSETLLEVKNREIAMTKEILDSEIRANGEKTAKAQEYQNKLQTLMNERTALETKVITDSLNLAKYWISESNAYYDRKLAYEKDIFAQETEALKRNYDQQAVFGKNQFDEEQIKLDKNVKDTIRANEMKFQSTVEYLNNEKQAIEQFYRNQQSLDTQQYNREKELINNKFEDTIGFYKDIQTEENKSSNAIQKAEKDKFNALDKMELDYLNKSIKNQTDRYNALMKLIADEEAMRIASLKKIEDLEKAKTTYHEKYLDAVRTANQSTMNEEQKYADQIVAINEAKNRFLETNDQKYLDAMFSDINSLPKTVEGVDGKIVKSAQDTRDDKIRFLKDYDQLQTELLAKQQRDAEAQAKDMKDLIEQNKQELESIKRSMEQFKDMKVQIETKKFIESIDVIKASLGELQAKIVGIEKEAPLRLNIEDIQAKLEVANQLVEAFKTKLMQGSDTSITISVNGPKNTTLEQEVKDSQTQVENLGKTVDNANPTVDVAVKGNENGTEVTLDYMLGQVQTQVNKLATYCNENPSNVFVALKGTAEDGSESTITKMLDSVQTSIANFGENFTKNPLMTKFKVSGDIGDGKDRTPTEMLGAIATDMEGFVTKLKENPPKSMWQVLADIGSGNTGAFMDIFNMMKTTIDGMVNNPTESKHTVEVPGEPVLVEAKSYHDKLNGLHTDSYHTVHVTHVSDSGSSGEGTPSESDRTGGWVGHRIGGFIQRFLKGGMPAFTGKVPGYGGGDIVDARLEPGEFVMRKEAVKKIGVNALRPWNNLNSSAIKSLSPQGSSQGTLFSGQLHTVDIKVGGESHVVYAPVDVLGKLTTSLRRTRLMKA